MTKSASQSPLSMPLTLNEKLNAIPADSFKGLKIGLEKESLRVNEEGRISALDHPSALGASLTHPYITTDFAEALLELITPPCDSSEETLAFLSDTETFVYQHLTGEKLWTTSMPCELDGEDDIRIAQYGSSNIGQMKTVYRRGLGHRYGKLMQVIAGVHFNFSFPASLRSQLYQLSQRHLSENDFMDQSYMDMIRNIQRYGWLVIYLFGASPAINKSFLNGVPGNLTRWDQDSLFEPYATSLRMGDIGYTNSKEGKTGIHIGYNTRDEYVQSMRAAINTPCPDYARIGVLKDGVYRQLNHHILQIENEHYSTVRPKQILQSMEKPTDALQQRGIEYIELRSLDINPFCPTGLTLEQLHFLELFMTFCWLKRSRFVTFQEHRELNHNQIRVAHQGRKPGLKLTVSGSHKTLQEHGKKLFDEMSGVAEKLDQAYKTSRYAQTLKQHHDMLLDPELTPSARILTEMRDQQESFMAFSLRKSCQHRDHYRRQQMSPETFAEFSRLAEQSLTEQHQLEAQEQTDFETFLKDYQGTEKVENLQKSQTEDRLCG